jgi:NADP-dependent 3-hydroxy acid dehydrogenase YdfG
MPRSEFRNLDARARSLNSESVSGKVKGHLCATEALVSEGARVVLNGRRADVLQAAATSIDPKADPVAHVSGDISRAATAGVVEAATQRFGGADLLF